MYYLSIKYSQIYWKTTIWNLTNISVNGEIHIHVPCSYCALSSRVWVIMPLSWSIFHDTTQFRSFQPSWHSSSLSSFSRNWLQKIDKQEYTKLNSKRTSEEVLQHNGRFLFWSILSDLSEYFETNIEDIWFTSFKDVE